LEYLDYEFVASRLIHIAIIMIQTFQNAGRESLVVGVCEDVTWCSSQFSTVCFEIFSSRMFVHWFGQEVLLVCNDIEE